MAHGHGGKAGKGETRAREKNKWSSRAAVCSECHCTSRPGSALDGARRRAAAHGDAIPLQSRQLRRHCVAQVQQRLPVGRRCVSVWERHDLGQHRIPHSRLQQVGGGGGQDWVCEQGLLGGGVSTASWRSVLEGTVQVQPRRRSTEGACPTGKKAAPAPTLLMPCATFQAEEVR